MFAGGLLRMWESTFAVVTVIGEEGDRPRASKFLFGQAGGWGGGMGWLGMQRACSTGKFCTSHHKHCNIQILGYTMR